MIINDDKKPPDDSKTGHVIAYLTVLLFLALIFVVPEVLEKKLYINPAFYLVVIVCSACFATFIITASLFRKFNKIKLGKVIVVIELVFGSVGSGLFANIVIKDPRLGFLIYYVVALAFFGVVQIVISLRQKKAG